MRDGGRRRKVRREGVRRRERRAKSVSWCLFLISVNLIIRAPPSSKPNHLSSAPLLNTIALGIRIQHMTFGKGVQFNSSHMGMKGMEWHKGYNSINPSTAPMS